MEVVLDYRVIKVLDKFSKHSRDRIIAFIEDLEKLDDPKQKGGALAGNLKGLWKYRVGDYRIIADIDYAQNKIYIAKIGDRKEVYK